MMKAHWSHKQQCPCGDDQCYLDAESYEEDELVEPMHLTEPNLSLGTPQTSLGVNKIVASPYVGQSFQSDDEALEYYTNFARNNGFLVRRERSKGNPEHPLGVYKRELVCHRAGPPLPIKSGEAKRQRKKKPSRCKCDAQMVIKKNISAGITRWVVVNFSNVHNHELLDSNDAQYFPGYRYISAVDRERILALAKGGCNVNLIMRALEMEKGVRPGELTFTEKDLKNFLQASMSINPESEGSELLKACKAMKEKNPDFRYEFTLYESNKLEHLAWSYAGSVRAYKLFGDVVFFDTTYRLHSYDRPAGVWFGVDNHGHTIFFCCVVLLDEKPDSYKWALQAFLRLMDKKFPQTILTDFHMGLKDAISVELPSTKHAFSIWHLMSKLPSWFSASLGPQYEKFKSEFYRIHDLDTEEEFEHQWNQMVVEFGLGSDKHAALLFSHRSYWAVPYLRNWFFGGLLTTGHSMSIRSFFRGFLNSQTRLKDIVEQVGVAVDFQNQAGEEATTQQSRQNIKIRTCLPIEEHASTILTHYAFEMFQKEIMLSTQFAVFETSRENYLVRHHLKSDGGHIVSCIASNEDICCTCRGFECTGILCKHTLRVLSLKNCFLIPEKYLLHRWRRESSLFPKSSGYKYRSQALRSLASIIIQESSITKDRFDYVQWHLSRLLNHVRDMPATDEAASDLEPSSSFDATVDVVPARSVTRGRPRKIRGIVKVIKETQASS
ncbi:protein FAR1-RELATED SEQUENCE 11 [Elaeis guineensis]|uniref:Protein FAR1-RELATED SEQUENCE n=1 Tax=Elaeis guineensis var. tenera TaxID=51953 RepID=A0A6I9QBC0_ELAGV|nr:protein FAR1-RELATED SEQUENCE 11 [Elaeis guineensis]